MTKGIDYTSRDYEAFKDLLITKLREKIPEYTDTSETDVGIVILEALANGLDILSLYLDYIANDIILPTTQDRKVAVILAQLLGYTPYNQTASELKQVFVLEETVDEDVTIPSGTIVTTPNQDDIDAISFETAEDLVIPKGYLGNEKDSEGNYLYAVPIVQGETIEDDVVGTSSGSPLQKFELNYPEVLIDSIELYVDEGLGDKLWERVDSFIDCTPESTVYKASLDEFDVCTIEFGDGLKGKIPVSYVNGITATYRIGGGVIGNVSANSVTELESDIDYVEYTFNLEPTILGHDKEDLESIKEKAPSSFRARDRLVTLSDYRELLLNNFYDFLDISAKVDTSNKKLVHIYYCLREPNTPIDSKMLEEVTEFITDRCMIGTSFDINLYSLQPVNIEGVLYVDSDYDKEELVKEVSAYLTEEIFGYGNLLFNTSIIKSEIESQVKNYFDGVLSFRISSPSGGIIKTDAINKILNCGTISIESQYL